MSTAIFAIGSAISILIFIIGSILIHELYNRRHLGTYVVNPNTYMVHVISGYDSDTKNYEIQRLNNPLIYLTVHKSVLQEWIWLGKDLDIIKEQSPEYFI